MAMKKEAAGEVAAAEQGFKKNYRVRERVMFINKEPSLTKQYFKEECDINNILKKFNATGQLPDMIKQNPVYGDFSDVASFQEALSIVNHAYEQFEALPSTLRDRFANDPEKFLAFCEDGNNLEELVKLGLAKKVEKEGAPSSAPGSGSKKSQEPEKVQKGE